LDSKRKFLEAATRYYELSLIGATGRKDAMVDENELMMSLSLALSCTVLAPAGTQRSRMLSTLFKDERCPGLPMYPLLEKVFKERILGREEVEAFSKTLSPHQLAILPDGSTVLDRSVMQHNLSALSKLYCNISFEELGAILGVSSDKAESIASDMIMEGRLVANVDQIDGFISFKQEEGLVQWDKRIQDVCVKVNSIVEDMQKSVQAVV
jgi:COP9 signalosome complex subunit 4